MDWWISLAVTQSTFPSLKTFHVFKHHGDVAPIHKQLVLCCLCSSHVLLFFGHCLTLASECRHLPLWCDFSMQTCGQSVWEELSLFFHNNSWLCDLGCFFCCCTEWLIRVKIKILPWKPLQETAFKIFHVWLLFAVRLLFKMRGFSFLFFFWIKIYWCHEFAKRGGEQCIFLFPTLRAIRH